MTNRLTLNEEVKPFFETDDKQIWNLILENNISDLLEILPREAEDTTFDKIVGELLSVGESETLANLKFDAIKESNSNLLRLLVRLMMALEINGNYDEASGKVERKILDSLPELVKAIQSESNGYPRQPISALVWMEGAGLRAVLNGLAYYYEKKEDIDHLHLAVILRTQITLAIMGHYKNIVGPDMVEAAKVKERIGQTEAALAFYNAVKKDFIGEFNYFRSNPELGINEDDIVIFQSLKNALLAIDRLNSNDEHDEICASIDEILSRELIEEPDFDEEDDE
ncbi:MAG: hypothetical protein E6767_06095 [Dysgonomonas sp.]|nr:hypothetical protein [Dysgonomonas sp.]